MVVACFCKMLQKDRKTRPPKSAPCWFLCETVGCEVLLFFFRNGKGRKKFNHPNVVHVIVPPVKKNRFSSSFHFCRTECAWMCHLSVPWQPPGKPPKVSKSCFWLFLHVFAKCCKKNKKLGRPKVLNLWLHPLWKRWFWGVTLHFFGSDTPGITWLCHHSVPWQPPTSCVEKHGPPKNVHPLLVARSTWKRAFFSRTSHRHRALLRFFFSTYVMVSRCWGGVGWANNVHVRLRCHVEVTFLLAVIATLCYVYCRFARQLEVLPVS